MKQKIISKKITVLLADDNPVNMALNIKMMELLVPNANLVEVINGKLALEACEKQNFDLILMDIQMPIMDGIEATKEIRKLYNYRDIPIIGLTAGNVLIEQEKCFNAGVSEMLPKPIKHLDLLNILAKYFEIEKDHFDETIKEVDTVNLQALEEQIGSDENFRNYFLELLDDELASSIVNLEQLALSRDKESVRMFLHKLKGTAGISGLTGLLKTIKKWEEVEADSQNFNVMNNEINEDIINTQKIIRLMRDTSKNL